MGKKQKSKKSKWDYFDDCEICQAMKRASEVGKDLSAQELKEAFRKAKANNKN